MDDNEQKVVFLPTKAIPWTQWRLVRTEDIAKLLGSQELKSKVITRLLGQVVAQRRIMARWAIDKKMVDVGLPCRVTSAKVTDELEPVEHRSEEDKYKIVKDLEDADNSFDYNMALRQAHRLGERSAPADDRDETDVGV